MGSAGEFGMDSGGCGLRGWEESVRYPNLLFETTQRIKEVISQAGDQAENARRGTRKPR